MRAADDFAVIRARMEELRKDELQGERIGRREPEQRRARTNTLTIGASDPKAVEEMKARIAARNRLWIEQH